MSSLLVQKYVRVPENIFNSESDVNFYVGYYCGSSFRVIFSSSRYHDCELFIRDAKRYRNCELFIYRSTILLERIYHE